ncbi:MAG: hypothetical protein HON90_00105 [Halobacteriovoraceae bacterium]|jgi:hypothetical protein|nr:hypothetical protein [Halobacteriovoraceae bacterium]
MKNSNYPTLLNRRARIFANLNRVELVFLASTYLFLSFIGIGGMKALLINIVQLLLFKLVSAKVGKSFFRFLRSTRLYYWSGSIGALDER